MMIKLLDQAFNPWQEIDNYQHNLAAKGKHGATCIFVGAMRDFNQGDTVQSMNLEHYPGMTEKQLRQIAAEAEQQWALLDTLILHRYGAILPDETIVLAATWSAQRGDAFDACRFIVEALKSRAPFWKKETLASGAARWVEKNSEGYQSKSDVREI